MKKIFVFISFVTLFSMFSCSQSEELASIEPNLSESVLTELDEDYAMLYQKIDDLNKSNNIFSRSWIRNLIDKIYEIFIADSQGALTNASAGPITQITGAVICSAKAAFDKANSQDSTSVRQQSLSNNMEYSISINSREEALSDLVFSNDENPSLSDSIGYYHNLILLNALNEVEISTDSAIVIAEALYDAASQAFNVPAEELKDSLRNNDQNFRLFLNNKLYKRLTNNETNSQLINRYINVFPSYASDFRIFERVMDGIVNLQGITQHNFVQESLNYIDNSTIPDSHKEALRKTIILGHASANLWNLLPQRQ